MAHPGGRPRKELTITDAPQRDFFTVPEAAALTHSHVRTIQARLRDGSLKGKKLGREWRIYPDSLVNKKVGADLNIENQQKEGEKR